MTRFWKCGIKTQKLETDTEIVGSMETVDP